MDPWDIVTKYAESVLPSPYSYLVAFILALIIYLINFYDKQNKDKIDKMINLNSKKIITALSLVIILTIFLVFAIYVHENWIFCKPPEDHFRVAISPFYLEEKEDIDFNTPEDIKKEIELVPGSRIEAVILDPPPIKKDEDAVLKGKRACAHLIIYGGDRKAVSKVVKIEF